MSHTHCRARARYVCLMFDVLCLCIEFSSMFFFSFHFSFTCCGRSFDSLTPIGMFDAPAINTSMTDPLSKVHPDMYAFNVESNIIKFFLFCCVEQSNLTTQFNILYTIRDRAVNVHWNIQIFKFVLIDNYTCVLVFTFGCFFSSI